MYNASCVVLNSTFEPLSIIPTRRALILCLQNKATVLQSYDQKVRSPSVEIKLPSTIALKKYIKVRKMLIPKKRGGPNSWENIVTSCSTCNHNKADLTLEQIGYTLRSKPYAPSMFEIFAKTKMKHFNLDTLYDEVLCSS
jgi:5-methylcytosine-specific restriction endonuclease McrA